MLFFDIVLFFNPSLFIVPFQNKSYMTSLKSSLVKLSYLLNFIGSGSTPKQNMNYYHGTISWVTLGDLNDSYIHKTLRTITTKAMQDTHLYLFPPNSLLVGLNGSVFKLGLLSIEATINQNCCGLVCNPHLLSYKYLFYFILYYRFFCFLNPKSVLFASITSSILKSIKLPFCSLSKQQELISFLDRKSHLIQELFQKIDLLLKKLEDYQTSLINEQVIQNNPSINYIKFKYLFKERNELTLDTLTYPCFSVSRIIGIIPLGKNVTKTRIPLKRKIIYPNDLVLKARSWGDHHYASALSSVTGSLSSVYFVFYSISNIINLKYMDYLFQSVFFKYQFLLLGKGIGDLTWSTHYNQLKELKWNFPSLLHQNEIVSFLTPKLEALSKLKHHYTSLKVLLEEYQQSLLYETFQNLL